MNDVAEAAGVARATVYRYFPNREALLAELALVAVNDVAGRLASARIDEVAPEEGVTRAVRALVDVGNWFVLLARERRRSDPECFERQLTEPIRRLFERGQASRGHPSGHHQRASDRVADRADHRRSHVPSATRQGGHDRHDHQSLP